MLNLSSQFEQNQKRRRQQILRVSFLQLCRSLHRSALWREADWTEFLWILPIRLEVECCENVGSLNNEGSANKMSNIQYNFYVCFLALNQKRKQERNLFA